MKSPALTLALLVAFLPVTAAELGRPDLHSEEFARRFAASWGVLSTREPQISELEAAILEKLAPMIAGSPSQAQYALESLLADGKPVSGAFNHVLGNLYFMNRDWARAEDQYREAIRKFPDFQRAWNSLGTLQMEQDDYRQGAISLARSIELGANDAATYGLLGYALLRSHSFVASEIAYNLALLRDPEGVQWLEGKARILSETGRHAETLAATDELLNLNPRHFEYWRLQANAHLALGHHRESARSLEIARAFGPLDGNALLLLGNIYLKEGMAGQALDAYLAAIKIEPRTAPGNLLRVAQSLLGQQQFDLARRLLDTMNPDASPWTPREEVMYHVSRARIAEHDGQPEAAIALLESAIVIEPTHPESQYRLAVLLAANGQGAKARYQLERIRGDTNYEYGALLLLAKMAVADGRHRDALSALRDAYRLNPSAEVESLYNRVRVAAESVE